jgi:hypothetical protein
MDHPNQRKEGDKVGARLGLTPHREELHSGATTTQAGGDSLGGTCIATQAGGLEVLGGRLQPRLNELLSGRLLWSP